MAYKRFCLGLSIQLLLVDVYVIVQFNRPEAGVCGTSQIAMRSSDLSSTTSKEGFMYSFILIPPSCYFAFIIHYKTLYPYPYSKTS